MSGSSFLVSQVDVCVVGMGYIGLPTALVLASNGKRVHGVDINATVVDKIRNGQPTFHEPEMPELLARVVDDGRLTISAEPLPASVFIVSVPTPIRADKTADTSYITAATEAIAPYLSEGSLVILESTSPVGTTQMMAKIVADRRVDLDRADVGFAHCPERVIPGRMIEEITNNDRVVGGLRPQDAAKAAALYRTFCRGEIHLTDAHTAEMTKLAENAFRDVNIAFANELSILANESSVNVWEVIELANKHPRVNILQPGPGVGGHCIAVDPWFLVSSAPDDAPLIRTARQINDHKPHVVIADIEAAASGAEKVHLAVFGVTFKANVDDLRGSPALEIAYELAVRNPHWQISVVEPYLAELPDRLSEFTNVALQSASQALISASVVALLVDHADFLEIPMSELLEKHIVDTRGLWRGRSMV